MNNVAFDLHSDNVFIRIDDSEGKKLFEKRVVNDLTKILEAIRPYAGEARFVLEATGNWYWLVDGLKAAGHSAITLANPLKMHAIAEAKVKTDARDAGKLAQLLRTGDIPPAYAYPAGPREIRDLLRHRKGQVERRTSCYLIMRSTLRKYNIKGDVSTDGLKRLTAEDMEQFPLSVHTRLILRQLIGEARFLRQETAAVEKALAEAVPAEPMVDLLKTVPGIGPILSMAIFYESGEVGRFPSHREYSSHCRVAKGTGNSNKKVCPGRKGKQGNPYLKWAYMQAAIGATRLDDRIGKLSKRYRERHGGKGAGLRANNMVAHKLAIAVYHMLRNRVPFDEKLFFSGMVTATPAHSKGR